MPDYNKPFEIESDTSLYVTGAVLLQQDTNGEWHPVAFHLQSMSPTERNYQVYDRELMAIIRALCDWHCYIYGSPFTTIVWTDHHNLTYYTHPQKLTRRQVHWVVEFMEYDLKLQHKKASKMVVADVLSQWADWSTGLEHDNEDVVALPESLWVRLMNTELQDAVATGQQEDNLVRDAIAKLSDLSVSPQRWTIETSGPDSSTHLLFYNGCLYIPDSLDLRRRIVSDHHDSRYSSGRASGIPGDHLECANFLLVAWNGCLHCQICSRLCYMPAVQGTDTSPAASARPYWINNESPLRPSWHRFHDQSLSLGRFRLNYGHSRPWP